MQDRSLWKGTGGWKRREDDGEGGGMMRKGGRMREIITGKGGRNVGYS
jgi:hypothetical protein